MVVKISKSARIEAGNLMEEASEIFESCVKCGLCKGRCGVFRYMREEQYSARGKGSLLRDKILDKILFECNLCKACEESCPLNVKVPEAVLSGRAAMVLLGKGTLRDEEMVKRARKGGCLFTEEDVFGKRDD